MDCLDDIQDFIDDRLDDMLRPHQKNAVALMQNGCVLYGGVGSGKSRTALAYYMKEECPKDVYVITTAKKRDSLEWVGEAAAFGIGRDSTSSCWGVLTVDSWNNIGDYADVEDAFFVFDEQRLVGNGAWVKAFLQIAHRNRWILLSATPGDVWLDYAPVFIANGWYKNITDFKRQHVVYKSFMKYPVIDRYIGEQKLERLRNKVLVEMPYVKHTERVVNYMDVGYDKDEIVRAQKVRWNPITDEPFKDFAELWRYVRRVVNTDPSRLATVQMLHAMHPRLIIFYNFDYELELLRTLETPGVKLEWNGHKHQELPREITGKKHGVGTYLPDDSGSSDVWLYFVQYTAGAEGWNCTSTDAMVFWSLTYSYKNWEQAMGRIDRLDTPFEKLYYYVLKSGAWIDEKLVRTLSEKKTFSERNGLKDWVKTLEPANRYETDVLSAKYLPSSDQEF